MVIGVVGAGPAGCTIARVCLDAGHKVTLYDAREAIGGLCADGYDDHGAFTQFHGPHIFHTSNRTVLDFLSRFTGWIPYVHRVWADVDRTYVPIPINTITLRMLSCSLEEAIDKLYHPYSIKMWGPYYEDFAAAAESRVSYRGNADCRYFQDTWQGLPLCGFSELFKNMVSGAELELGCSIRSLEGISAFHGLVFFTGRLDMLYGQDLGALPYRTIKSVNHWSPETPNQKYPVVNHPASGLQLLRSTCTALLYGDTSAGYSMTYDYPEGGDAELLATHPVVTPESTALYQEYVKRLPSNVIPAGRAGLFSYHDIDMTVGLSLGLAAPYIEEL